MKHIDTIIIGAGISGISLANQLDAAGIENCIIEKNQIGGCIETLSYKNIWFEIGAHTIYNSYSKTISFIKKNHLEDRTISRKKLPFLIVHPNGKIQSIFKNLNLISLTLNFLKNRKISKKNKTVSEYAKKLFGDSNYNKTLKYCFDAVLSQDSENFPMEYLFKKYARDTTLPRSFTFKDGLSTLFKNIKTNTINETVKEISKDSNDNWVIKTNTNSYTAKNICLATPWDTTEELLKNILPTIANHPYRPTISNLVSIAIVINKDQLSKLKNIAGLIGKQHFFYSAVSRDVINHNSLRAITFHCKDISKPKEELLNKICETLKINKKNILHHKIKYNVLPCYNKNHYIFLSDMEKQLNGINNLFITGNFFDRLAIENCIIRSTDQANKIIQNKASI
ncbi:NAD(P)-binding protein [Allofrancisella guangzhouensis]|nr:NAD(P)-binding protein [Allofrancisella guangzhouensis]